MNEEEIPHSLSLIHNSIYPFMTCDLSLDLIRLRPKAHYPIPTEHWKMTEGFKPSIVKSEL